MNDELVIMFDHINARLDKIENKVENNHAVIVKWSGAISALIIGGGFVLTLLQFIG